MTHTELVEIAYKWAMKRCGFVFKELVTINQEQPDMIGFVQDYTFLIECKVSRADFFADSKKPFRKYRETGMGDFRFFCCPKGLIKIEELPRWWGLVEVNEKGTARVKHNPFGKGSIYSKWLRLEKNDLAERRMMYSALRWLELRGRIEEIYNLKSL